MPQQISNGYEMGQQLGSGGFGDVYRATRREDGREVAIKVLRDDLPDTRRRFEREVRLLQDYQHPAIMKVLDVALGASPPFYVMPFYKNGSLAARVGRVTGPEFWLLFEGLVEVLVFLAERNAFHRDLKPDNILIDDNGRPVLCDFGLGSDPALTADFTRNGVGTVGYVAPELWRIKNGASPKCDVYSLGATAFHLLTGVHPGEARHLDIAAYLVSFPIEMRNMILAMVDPDPTRRPAARDLSAWLASVRDRAGPVIRRARAAAGGAAEAVGKTPAWVIALFVILIVGAGVGVGLWIRSMMEEENERET